MATAASAFDQQKRAMPWWIPLIEGIALIIVGVLLFTSPLEAILSLTRVLGLFWFLSGIFEIVSIFVDRSAWGWKLIGGIIGLLAGYYLFTAPAAGALILGFTLVVMLGVQALLLGIVHIVQALRGAGWAMGVIGIINIIFAVLLLGNVLLSMALLPWLFATFAIIGGIATIYMALRLRSA
ncbi:MAG: DUF308 domain-containing protein [Anaerolineae bacterium]|nr:DUF308 domain-containing protein [Anaerolineae bacterium]